MVLNAYLFDNARDYFGNINLSSIASSALMPNSFFFSSVCGNSFQLNADMRYYGVSANASGIEVTKNITYSLVGSSFGSYVGRNVESSNVVANGIASYLGSTISGSAQYLSISND